MKKFIRTEGEKVLFIHNMPFDSVHGMGKTEEELSKEGVLLDEIPEPEQRDGKVAKPYYTPEKGFWWEYDDAPPRPATTADIEELNAKIDYVGMMTEVL